MLEHKLNENAISLSRFARLVWLELGVDAMRGCQVAVIGGGPAGTLCAAQFAKRGARVTVYERKSCDEQVSVRLGWPIALGRMGTDAIDAAGLSSDFGPTYECGLQSHHAVRGLKPMNTC